MSTHIARPSPAAEYRHAEATQRAAYDADDLLHELCQIGELLLNAVRANDAKLIGRLVLAVVEAQIEGRACFECEQESAGVDAAAAAAEVMRVHAPAMRNTLAMANGRHNARRFTGSSVTGWGLGEYGA